MKGINDDEIEDFLQMTIDRPIQVRFIEYMPIGHQDEDWKSRYLSLTTVLDRCKEKGGMLLPRMRFMETVPLRTFELKEH